MGIPSISILLHEVFKLLEYSGCGKDVTFFRLGTCGGLGLRPGTVVISHVIYDGLFRTHLEQVWRLKMVIFVLKNTSYRTVASAGACPQRGVALYSREYIENTGLRKF